MSFSKVQICNMALGKVGVSQQISALEFSEDESVPNEARLCALYFPLAFEAAAASHDWTCLTKPADISANVTTAPPFGYSYAYQLPADCLRFLRIEGEETDGIEYRRVGKTIQTDEATVQIWYIRATEDTTLYDPLFTEALVMRLAAHLAPALLTGDEGQATMNNLITWHEKVVLPLARFADSSQRSPVTLESTTWKNARL